QRRKAGRPAGIAVDSIRVRHQSSNSTSARHRGVTGAALDRRRGDRMKRREFMTLLGGAAAAWPVAVRAQQPALPVIGFLSSTSRQVFASRLGVFAQGLKAEGYVDGQNVAIEYRFAEDEENRLPALAVELAQQRLTVCVASGSRATGGATRAGSNGRNLLARA